MLGKLSVPGHPTNLDKRTAMTYSACSRRGWVLFGPFSLIYHFSFLSPSLWETARHINGALSSKQPTNPFTAGSTEKNFPVIGWPSPRVITSNTRHKQPVQKLDKSLCDFVVNFPTLNIP